MIFPSLSIVRGIKPAFNCLKSLSLARPLACMCRGRPARRNGSATTREFPVRDDERRSFWYSVFRNPGLKLIRQLEGTLILTILLLLAQLGSSHSFASGRICTGECRDPGSNAGLVKNAGQFLPALSRLAAGANASREYGSEEEAWRDTGLTFESLRKVISNKECNTDPNASQACLWAMNAILSYRDTLAVWVPRDYYERHRTDFQGVTVEVSPFVLSKWSPVKERDLLRSEKAYRKYQKSLFEALSKQRELLGPKADFESILKHSEHFVMRSAPSREAEITAAAWNAYFGILLDPHVYVALSPKVQIRSPSFAGIGVILKDSPQGISIKPDGNSQAAQAGIQDGDELVQVDGEPIRGLTVDAVRSKIIGPEDSSVKVTILRAGQEHSFDIQRKKMVQRLSADKTMTIDGVRVGYVSLQQFASESCSVVRQALQNVLRSNPKGIVLDLRGNRGGRTSQAVCIASLFLDPGKEIVRLQTKEATAGEPLTRLPLVVLMNSSSASASEILAGALQEHERALILGERSYGKGSFQFQGQFKGYPMLMMAVTEGVYTLPSGRSPQLVGILPDIEAYSDPAITKEEDSPALREEDLYMNPLPPVESNDPPFNIYQARKARECLAKHSGAREQYEKDRKAGKSADYQLLLAAEIVGKCWTEKDSAMDTITELRRLDDCVMIGQIMLEFGERAESTAEEFKKAASALHEKTRTVKAYRTTPAYKREYRALQDLDDTFREARLYFNVLRESSRKQNCQR